jgi:hypothetical protein
MAVVDPSVVVDPSADDNDVRALRMRQGRDKETNSRKKCSGVGGSSKMGICHDADDTHKELTVSTRVSSGSTMMELLLWRLVEPFFSSLSSLSGEVVDGVVMDPHA